MNGDTMSTRDTGNTLMNGMTTFSTPRRSSSRVGWKDIWVHIIRNIGVWCNGSIPVSKTVGESSSLSTPARDWSVAQMVEHQILVLRVVGSNPAISTNMSGWPRGSGSGLQNHLHRFDSGTRLQTCPCSVMDSTPDYGSVREGSSPSRGTTINISTHSLVG